jgi:hypothetical protein
MSGNSGNIEKGVEGKGVARRAARGTDVEHLGTNKLHCTPKLRHAELGNWDTFSSSFISSIHNALTFSAASEILTLRGIKASGEYRAMVDREASPQKRRFPAGQ